jgi:uncharacterized protein YkwD
MALASYPKPQSHHKKARGAHHRQSKHYLKAYAPYLPLLLIVLVGLAVNVFWSNHAQVLGATTSLTTAELLQDTNHERTTHYLDPLKLNTKLSTAAQAKANDMVARGYWSHDTPDGDKPWKFIQKSGYDYGVAGENLAYGFTNSAAAITGWMNSPEHRSNILSADYQEVGFGIVSADNYQNHGKTTLVVAMYAEPAVNGASAFSGASTEVPSEIPLRTVSRVQLLTGGDAPWSLALMTLASLVALAWFVTRHVKVWHRVLIQSEEFVVRHKMLDIVFVATAVTGYVLTRSVGFIH